MINKKESLDMQVNSFINWVEDVSTLIRETKYFIDLERTTVIYRYNKHSTLVVTFKKVAVDFIKKPSLFKWEYDEKEAYILDSMTLQVGESNIGFNPHLFTYGEQYMLRNRVLDRLKSRQVKTEDLLKK